MTPGATKKKVAEKFGEVKKSRIFDTSTTTKPNDMNLFSTTTNSPVIRGQFNSTNGMTRDEDTLPTIFIGKKENADEFITRTKLKEFRQRFGNRALVVYTWAPCGKLWTAAEPIDIILDGCDGTNGFGGNQIEIDGQQIDVHDRVETWEQYRALSV